jgi:hypothetical protein
MSPKNESISYSTGLDHSSMIEEEGRAELPPLPYDPPKWSGLPKERYYLEVIRNGLPLENLPLSKSKEFLMIGKSLY